MEITGSSISSGAVSQATQQRAGDAVGVQVLSKAMDIQAVSARQMLDSIPEVQAPSEPHLGNNVNVKA